MPDIPWSTPTAPTPDAEVYVMASRFETETLAGCRQVPPQGPRHHRPDPQGPRRPRRRPAGARLQPHLPHPLRLGGPGRALPLRPQRAPPFQLPRRQRVHEGIGLHLLDRTGRMNCPSDGPRPSAASPSRRRSTDSMRHGGRASTVRGPAGMRGARTVLLSTCRNSTTPPRPADHLPSRWSRRPPGHRDHRRRGGRHRARRGRERHPAPDRRRRQQPGHRRPGLRRHRPAHRDHRLRPGRDAAGARHAARTGATPSPAPSRAASSASSASPGSPARPVPRPSRTWGRTARRSATPSPRSSPTTAPPARRSPSAPPSAPSGTATAPSRTSPTATSCCACASPWRTAGGLSAPIKYPETARALGVEAA